MIVKKPDFWDLKRPNLLAYLLLPFTLIIKVNNFFGFKKKILNRNIKSICIGNIYLGGTGKTPSTIKIYKILKKIETNTVIGKSFINNQVDEIKLLQKECKILTHKKRSEILKKPKIKIKK